MIQKLKGGRYVDYRVDEKGKVFTQFMHKEQLAVSVRMGGMEIRGTIHLTPGNRLKDELVDDKSFIAITNVQVLDAVSQQPCFQSQVLILNKQHITWILPQEQSIQEPIECQTAPSCPMALGEDSRR